MRARPKIPSRLFLCLIQWLELALRARARRGVPAGPAPPPTHPTNPLGAIQHTCEGGCCGHAHAITRVQSARMSAASIQAVGQGQNTRVGAWLRVSSDQGTGCQLQ